MDYKSAAAIRQIFIDYFKDNGHKHIPSASLVPAGDPSLLFTNSGMVPFKDCFLGKEKRDYSRAVSAQRCVRAGGKHNDLENVGYTARHHTFFEMLGNFSFGDYFKDQAINFAWELITEKIGLPADKLWVTVHHTDDEAAEIWHKNIGIPENRIAKLGEDNFWQMGDTGPCGPCSEIFYDHGEGIPGDPPGGPNEGDRYIEVWNLVFMQFNRSADGEMTPLPKPSVDTGMGLERIAAVLQGVHNNYETDLFAPLLKLANELCGGKNKEESDLSSQRIIADHIRSSAFLIADGINPSNEGRGYVLRRIIRRALRHANKLKIEAPFFYKFVAPLAAEMGSAHPLIKEKQSNVEEKLRQEEERFSQTLEQGLALLKKETANISGGVLNGEVAFKLYDTYGFPPDLTEDIGREEGFRLDWGGFNHEMDEQKKRSRVYSMFRQSEHSLPSGIKQSEFVGYEESEASAKLIHVLDGEKETKRAKQGEEVVLVLDKTPFYAESGGQIGDIGQIYSSEGMFRVSDTQKQDGVFLHFGKVEEGYLSKGDDVTARIDPERRQQISRHHTATHLLHAALHKFIGKDARQRGSRVADNSLRLDFSHDRALSEKELEQVEDWIKEHIQAGLEIKTSYKSLDEAKKEGAMALFGEKYGEKVRVVDIGEKGEFSKELCGGIHCQNTGEIEDFIILKESSISAGIRRVEAVVAARAKSERQKQKTALTQIKIALGIADDQKLAARVEELAKKVIKQEKEISKLRQDQQINKSMAEIDERIKDLPLLEGVPVLNFSVDNLEPVTINQLVDRCRAKMKKGIIIMSNKMDGRCGVLISTSKDFSDEYPANGLMAYLAKELDGNGGGNSTRAQGGVGRIDKLAALSEEWIKKQSKH